MIDGLVMSTAPARSRVRAWLPTVATIAAVALCITAGNWQRGRMLAKESLRAQLDAATHAPAASLPQGSTDWSAWRFRPVRARGRFVAERQFLLDNRVHAGVVGFDVVTPLAVDDGRAVLVDRGFVKGGASRAELPEVAVPRGYVEVVGRVAIPPARYFELGKQAGDAKVQEHLDIARIASATGLALMPIVIEATAPTYGDETLVREWPAPDLGVDTNRSYMAQWYLFATLAAGLWAWFTWRGRLGRRTQ